MVLTPVRHGGLAAISCGCGIGVRFPPSGNDKHAHGNDKEKRGNDKHAHGQSAGAGFSRCGVGARVPWEPRQT